MSKTIFLDTGVLGLMTNPNKSQEVLDCLQWAVDMLNAGHHFIVPSIADYEVRRELIRAGKTNGIVLLNAWNAGTPDRYFPLSDAALHRAAPLWAQTRNAGKSTCDPKELDCDVLIACQALDFGLPSSHFIVATTNIGHLSLFVPAEKWGNININF
jgi:hypothetical protein